MRIVYLISYAGRAGTEKYVEDLMRLYALDGHDCRLAYAVPGALAEKISAAGFPVVRLDMSPRHAVSCAKRLAEYCRDNNVDVIHAQYPRENVIAVLSRLWRKETKVVFTCHLTRPQGLLWRLCNHIITPYDAAVISVCSPGVKQLRENGVVPEKICYIPNGVLAGAAPERMDMVRKEFGLRTDCFLFITFARYVPEKGLDVLVRALCVLKEMTDSPFVCVIAGDGPLFESIRRQTKALGLTNNVIQTGFRGDTQALLCSSDAYVSSAVRAEAMSFSILEAMCCALPLAVTDVGAGRELAERCGYVSSPGDAAGLADSLFKLISEPVESRALGQAARKRAETSFDLRQSAEMLMKIYKS